MWLTPAKTSAGFGIQVAVVLSAIALGAWSFCALRSTENPRFVISEKTAVASEILSLSYLTLPLHDPIGNAAVDEAQISHPVPPAAAVIRPKADLFLITVDAMRTSRYRFIEA